MKTMLLIIVILSITASSLAEDDDSEIPFFLREGTYHVPSFVHLDECQIYKSKYNIFSSVADQQTKCGGNFDGDDSTNDGVVCGDSRRPWCSKEVDQSQCIEKDSDGVQSHICVISQCVATKPTDENIQWAYSLPTEAELADCLNHSEDCVNEAWKTSIPTAMLTVDDVDSNIQCLPTPNEMPTFDCDSVCTECAATSLTMVPDWPDALYCGNQIVPGMVFMLAEVLPDTVTYQYLNQNDYHFVRFNIDKTWKDSYKFDYVGLYNECKGKSIDQIASNGKAIFYDPIKEPSSTSSMYPNKPDVIRCPTGKVYYANHHKNSQTVYGTMDSLNLNYVIFNSDGTFQSRFPTIADNACFEGRTIQNLYDENLAYNLVFSVPNRIAGVNTLLTAKKYNDQPFALNCATDPNQKQIFWLETFTGWGKYLVYREVRNIDSNYIFKKNGDFKSLSNKFDKSDVYGCYGKSIDDIAREGRAYIFNVSVYDPTSKDINLTGTRTIVPNIASIRPALWNSCGADPTDGTQAFYCTNSFRPYCHLRNAEGFRVNACLAEASTSTEGNGFDYSAWQSAGTECFKDLMEIDPGFTTELKLWTFDYIQKGNVYTDFQKKLDDAIGQMNNGIKVREMERQTKKKIKMPINCPQPPEEEVSEAVLPCLLAAVSAKKISHAVSSIDIIKVDHIMKESLKTKDYRMISEMTECSGGKKFPCNEQVLYYKPDVSEHSLHCFVENKLISNVNIDLSCFTKGFSADYYNEYRNYLNSIAIKWIEFIEKNIFPRELCDTYKFQDSETLVGYPSKDYFQKACLQERSKLSVRDEILICGGTRCCDNAEIHMENLVCINKSIDRSKGTWAHILSTGTCDSDCDISDLELSIYFNYIEGSGKTGEININVENEVTSLTTDQIMTNMVLKADNPVDVCLLNRQPGQTCGFSYLDHEAGPDGDKISVTNGARNAHYCLNRECCIKKGNDYTCEHQTGLSCPANTTVHWFNYSQHAECQKVTSNNQGEAESTTEGGQEAAKSLAEEDTESDTGSVDSSRQFGGYDNDVDQQLQNTDNAEAPTENQSVWKKIVIDY